MTLPPAFCQCKGHLGVLASAFWLDEGEHNPSIKAFYSLKGFVFKGERGKRGRNGFAGPMGPPGSPGKEVTFVQHPLEQQRDGWEESLRPWYLSWLCFHLLGVLGQEHIKDCKANASLLFCFPCPTGDSWDTRTQRQQGEYQPARQLTSS